MDWILNLMDNFYFSSVFKLFLGFILAGIIGLERKSWNKPAGFRTHSLVGISSVLVVLCGEYMSLKYDIDPTRIAAQLLSGIGFIGAGTILRDGFNVKGLTTASSLLTVTCIGLCIGCGFYLVAIIATLITYILLSYSYLLTDKLDHFNNSKLLIIVKKFDEDIFEKIETILEHNDVLIKKLEKSSIDNSEDKILNIEIKYNQNPGLNKVISKISGLDVVKSIEEI